MKRFILVLFMFGSLLSSVVASNYSDAKVVKDVGLPSFVSHIEFWNGGSKIYEADNASIIIKYFLRNFAVVFNRLRKL